MARLAGMSAVGAELVTTYLVVIEDREEPTITRRTT
jgi:hypothetical protein